MCFVFCVAKFLFSRGDAGHRIGDQPDAGGPHGSPQLHTWKAHRRSHSQVPDGRASPGPPTSARCSARDVAPALLACRTAGGDDGVAGAVGASWAFWLPLETSMNVPANGKLGPRLRGEFRNGRPNAARPFRGSRPLHLPRGAWSLDTGRRQTRVQDQHSCLSPRSTGFSRVDPTWLSVGLGHQPATHVALCFLLPGAPVSPPWRARRARTEGTHGHSIARDQGGPTGVTLDPERCAVLGSFRSSHRLCPPQSA